MQMTLTITAETPSELVTVLAALQGAGIGEPIELKTGSTPVVEAVVTAANKPVVTGSTPVVEAVVTAANKPVVTGSTPVVEAVVTAANKPVVVDPPRRGRPPKAVEPVKEPAKLKVVEKSPDPPKVEPPKAPEPEPEKEVTMSDVRRALTEFLQANDEPTAAALLAKHGHTDRLSKLDPQYYAAVYKAAATPAKSNSGAPFDDDISSVGGA